MLQCHEIVAAVDQQIVNRVILGREPRRKVAQAMGVTEDYIRRVVVLERGRTKPVYAKPTSRDYLYQFPDKAQTHLADFHLRHGGFSNIRRLETPFEQHATPRFV